MNRYKFRILLDGHWHYWGFVEVHGSLAFAGLPSSNMVTYSLKEMMDYSQQSTGIPDKSGKEIFEGDRICIDGGGAKKPYLEVIFEEGCFGVQWPDSNFASLKYYTNMKFCTVEIIGNIYENPELWEAANEDNP